MAKPVAIIVIIMEEKYFLPPLLLGKSETRFKGKNSIHRVHKIHQDSSRVNSQNVFSVGKYLLPTASMYEYLLLGLVLLHWPY